MKPKASFKLAGVAALLLLAEGSAWSDVLPGAAMPEQVSRSLKTTQPQPQAAPIPAVTQPKPAESAMAEQAKKIKFQLNDIVIEGNRIYSDEQLRSLYSNQLNKTITVADLFDIVQNITNFYRNNGYVISRAILPPQHVKNGVVEVRIIEGYIGTVDVSGDSRGVKCQVLAMGCNIRKCPPLEIKRMERYLLLTNEIPGTQVKAVLSPSKTATGAADLTLVTQNKPVQGYVSYDNYGTRYIGPQQMTANVEFNSFGVPGDATLFTMTKTPKGGELTYQDLNYTFPIDNEGDRWQVGSTRAHTHPLFVLQPNQIDGLNSNYYTMMQFPWIRTRTQSLTMRAGFNYLDSNVTTFGFPLYTDHLRNIDFGGSYNFSDRWYGANLISADIRQGLPIWGYSSDHNVTTATTSRPGGYGEYTKIAAQMSRLQAVRGPVSLYGIITGQWAFVSLLSSEQFTFGGSQLGRGYDVAELIGDKGAAASLELRYDWNVSKFYIQMLEFYTFYDIGAIWNIEVNPTSPAKVSASSAGLGVRLFGTNYISGNLMWAQPLTKQVAAEELIGDGWRPRVFFSLVASFV